MFIIHFRNENIEREKTNYTFGKNDFTGLFCALHFLSAALI